MVAGSAVRFAWEIPSRLIIDNNMAAGVMTGDEALRSRIETALHSALHGRTGAP